MRIRRVVTGHDEHGRSEVSSDAILDNVISRRPGHQSCVVWATGSAAAASASAQEPAQIPPTAVDDGIIVRVIEYAPGVAARPHRTDSVDYLAVLTGSIELELDTRTVTLGPGDVVVQRATRHNWVNRGSEPCRVLVVLVGAGVGAGVAS